MRRALVLLLILVSLSGCVDEAPGLEETGPATEVGAAVGAPVWAVGDHWTYQSPFGTFALAVSSDSGSDYILDTDDPDLAFIHAAFDPVSYLGPMSKATLAGDDGGARTIFFGFPLEDGKTWNTQLDGVPLEVMAHDQGGGRFHFMAHDEAGVMRHQWVYDNATRFFEWASFGDENGTEQYRIDLESSGRGWTGELVRVTPESVLTLSGTGPAHEASTLDFAGTGDADLFASIALGCQQGAAAFAVGPLENIPGAVGLGLEQNDDGYNFAGPCPTRAAFFGVIGEEPETGTWGYFLDSASADLAWDITVWLRHFERFTLSDSVK